MFTKRARADDIEIKNDVRHEGLAAGTKKVRWSDTVDIEGVAHG